ncbi:HNH nuclease family protein [Mariprofundus sp. NF]|uniref:YajD family HNH nuclease n=1 Tax=Mariprofundus sp. NF TaxID=2608716 RepID=UPI0015A0BD9F|nr:YajD family HNH nuclease [Mariprofundus sp. NF]NWF38395.1 HNH nuclease family protein [Mariprofundus sp. NF]
MGNESYREQALKLYPWVCGRCGRDFAGKQLKELTVHHRDHNHSNNPPDGSNWELLCIYCHDNEHQRYMEADAQGDIKRDEASGSSFKGLAGLAALLKEKE